MTTAVSVGEWADELLALLGAPQTENNEDKIATWADAEQGDTWGDYGNPLNTTEPGFGGEENREPETAVPGYPDLAAGAEAAAATLLGSSADYGSIVSNLRDNGSQSQFDTALEDSPWDAGHYSYDLGQVPPLALSLTSEGPDDTGDEGMAQLESDVGTTSTSLDDFWTKLFKSFIPGSTTAPLNVVGDEGASEAKSAAGSAASGVAGTVWKEVEPFLATAIFVIAGLGMMGLGLYKAVTGNTAKQGVVTVGKSVGVAAAA